MKYKYIRVPSSSIPTFRRELIPKPPRVVPTKSPYHDLNGLVFLNESFRLPDPDKINRNGRRVKAYRWWDSRTWKFRPQQWEKGAY